jgi:hypothetical protein
MMSQQHFLHWLAFKAVSNVQVYLSVFVRADFFLNAKPFLRGQMDGSPAAYC